MADSPDISELVGYLARSLVDHPESVKITEVASEQAVVYELEVAREDLGKVIGKQGRTARAMRTLLAAASSGQRRRVQLEILD